MGQYALKLKFYQANHPCVHELMGEGIKVPL